MTGERHAGSQADAMGAGRFRALVVYDDFAASREALELCNFLNVQLGGEVEFSSTLWKFDLLRHPGLSQIAAWDAIEADMVIVALSRGGDLPQEVEQWAEVWAQHQGKRVAALVALLENRQDQKQAEAARASLKAIAARAGLDFLVRGVPSPTLSPPGETPVLRTEPGGEIERRRFDGWGLND